MLTAELLKKAKKKALHILENEISPELVFHSRAHTEEVVAAGEELATEYQLSAEEIENIVIALWFHDLGFIEGWEGHEERSAALATTFLQSEGVDQQRIEAIRKLILTTHREAKPTTLHEEIIKDADTSHIGSKTYLSKLGLLRTEWEKRQDTQYTEKEWLSLNLDFLDKHKYYTALAQTKYNNRKRKNILKLQRQWEGILTFEENALKDRPGSLAEFPPRRADRGVETMFRVTLRNHNNLSRIADNKANIMLSINAIMLSIVISSLTPKLDSNPRLIIPTVIIIIVCMISIILATLSTRPKITNANYSDEKFLKSKFNILFFGNFYQLPIEKFEWGVQHLMNNERMLYSSLSKDLYYLGLVLAKKYRYLYICYNIFMIGLLIAAIAFIVSFLPSGPV